MLFLVVISVLFIIFSLAIFVLVFVVRYVLAELFEPFL